MFTKALLIIAAMAVSISTAVTSSAQVRPAAPSPRPLTRRTSLPIMNPSPVTQPATTEAAPPAPESAAPAVEAAPANSAVAATAAGSGGDPQEAAAPGVDGVNQVIPAPVLLSYREVKDNFGKRIADTYVVVQVNIKNPDIEHQFLLQDLRIVFDPNQCEQAGRFYEVFDIAECQQQYNKYLKYPIAYAPVAQPALQAVASVGQYKNPRNFAFRFLDFAANMGGALTGFNFIGRDGKAGLSVFNGTFLTASKTFVPDLTVGQVTRLTEQSYKPNTLVESKDTKTYDVFIPTNQIFSKETWKLYKQDVGDATAEAIEMRRLLQLVVTATASGTHVQKVEGDNGITTTGGGAPPTP